MKIIMALYLLIIFQSVSLSQEGWHQTNFNTFYNVRNLIIKNENVYVGLFCAGIQKSTNNGTNTFYITGNINEPCIQSLLYKDSILFAGTTSSGLFKTSNDGQHWELSNNGVSSNNFAVLDIVEGDNIVFINTGYDGIYKSLDEGSNWTKISNSLPSQAIRTLYYLSGNLITGIDDYGIYKSTNQGNSWVPVNSGLPNNHTRPWRFIEVNSIIFVSIYGYGVYKSIDFGNTWTQTNNPYHTSISLSFSNKNNFLFVGTHTYGVYMTSDYGNNWVSINNGLYEWEGVPAIMCNNTYLFAGTFSRGVFCRKLSEVIGTQTISTEIPKSFSLHQNYPNPFNPATKIQFNIPVGNGRDHSVKLMVYDILGKEISVLVNQELSPGVYEVDCDGSNLPSGIYYYRLTAGSFTQTKKMVLIK